MHVPYTNDVIQAGRDHAFAVGEKREAIEAAFLTVQLQTDFSRGGINEFSGTIIEGDSQDLAIRRKRHRASAVFISATPQRFATRYVPDDDLAGMSVLPTRSGDFSPVRRKRGVPYFSRSQCAWRPFQRRIAGLNCGRAAKGQYGNTKISGWRHGRFLSEGYPPV